MKKFTHLFLLFLFSVFVLQIVITACSQEVDCSSTSRKMVYANIYTLQSGKVVKDTLDSLTVTAVGTDSIIINKDVKVDTVLLPLRYTADSTKLIFHYAKTKLVDTLVIWHTNTPTFISMDCGYSMAQVISKIRYTKNLLDSVYISYNTANTDGIQNLKLFY